MNPSKPDPYSAAPDTSGNGNRQSSGEGRGLAAKSHEAAARTQDVALNRVEDAKRAADTAQHRASERVRAIGAAVRSLGQQLRASNERTIASYADRTSDRIDGVASFIETAEPNELLRDGADLARRNPLKFFGGTLLVGLTIGRFLKSSTQAGGRDVSSETLGRTFEDRSYAVGGRP